MAVTNNVVFVLVDNKQSLDESKEIKALKYDLSQKDIEISNLKNNITTLNNTVSELKSDIKRVIPDLSEFDKFKLTPEYPKFKQEFLEVLIRFEKWGSTHANDNHDMIQRTQDLYKIRKEYKFLEELHLEIDLIIKAKNSNFSHFIYDLVPYARNNIGMKFNINYIEFYTSIQK